MKFCSVVLGLFFELFLPFVSFAQIKDSLLSQLGALEESSLLSRGAIGLWVQEESSGVVLMNYNGKKSFVPASNLKLVTTASALSLLGGNYKYSTRGYYSGKVDSAGVLKGNLYILGSGDPSFGSDQLVSGRDFTQVMDNWVQLLLKSGIKAVTGDVIIDPSTYDQNPVPDFWTWTDMGNYYGAGIHGVNIADNTLRIYFKQNREKGAPVKLLRVEPLIDNLKYDNRVVTGPDGSGDKAYIYGAPYQSNRMILGTLSPGEGEYKIKGSIPDPPFLFGQLLKQRLKANGILCKGEVKVKQIEDGKSLQKWFEYQSLNLSELIRITNFNSINLYAESILQQMALAKTGKGKRNVAISLVKRYWSSQGIDTLGWIMLDGSGLSPLNAISPQQMVQILAHMKTSKEKDAFIESIPIAGKDGTVSSLGKNTALENNARIKSGSFKGTLCYSGYMITKSKKRVVFSIMMNRYEGEMKLASKKLQKILETVAEF